MNNVVQHHQTEVADNSQANPRSSNTELEASLTEQNGRLSLSDQTAILAAINATASNADEADAVVTSLRAQELIDVISTGEYEHQEQIIQKLNDKISTLKELPEVNLELQKSLDEHQSTVDRLTPYLGFGYSFLLWTTVIGIPRFFSLRREINDNKECVEAYRQEISENNSRYDKLGGLEQELEHKVSDFEKFSEVGSYQVAIREGVDKATIRSIIFGAKSESDSSNSDTHFVISQPTSIPSLVVNADGKLVLAEAEDLAAKDRSAKNDSDSTFSADSFDRLVTRMRSNDTASEQVETLVKQTVHVSQENGQHQLVRTILGKYHQELGDAFVPIAVTELDRLLRVATSTSKTTYKELDDRITSEIISKSGLNDTTMSRLLIKLTYESHVKSEKKKDAESHAKKTAKALDTAVTLYSDVKSKTKTPNNSLDRIATDLATDLYSKKGINSVIEFIKSTDQKASLALTVIDNARRIEQFKDVRKLLTTFKDALPAKQFSSIVLDELNRLLDSKKPKLEQAAKLLEDTRSKIEGAPENSEAIGKFVLQIAESYAANGDTDKCIKLIETSKVDASGIVRAAIDAAASNSQNETAQEVILHFKDSLKADQLAPRANFQLSYLCYTAEDFETAREFYDAVADKLSSNDRVKFATEIACDYIKSEQQDRFVASFFEQQRPPHLTAEQFSALVLDALDQISGDTEKTTIARYHYLIHEFAPDLAATHARSLGRMVSNEVEWLMAEKDDERQPQLSKALLLFRGTEKFLLEPYKTECKEFLDIDNDQEEEQERED